MTEKTVTKTRLEAFRDGVLAIAITLLVIGQVLVCLVGIRRIVR